MSKRLSISLHAKCSVKQITNCLEPFQNVISTNNFFKPLHNAIQQNLIRQQNFKFGNQSKDEILISQSESSFDKVILKLFFEPIILLSSLRL